MNEHTSRESQFLGQAAEIVLQNLEDEQFGVPELARYMRISRSTLHRRLMSYAGVPASKFILSIKLNRAVDLLKTSAENISQVAFESGFRSVTYFNKCFKDQFGFSPRHIRSEDPEKIRIPGIPAEPEIFAKVASMEDETGTQLYHFPAYATSFIGREKEISVIHELLQSNHVVTLAGPGGCGKTRLACEVASGMESHFEHGIWFVNLAQVERAELVTREVMRALEIPEVPGKDLGGTLAGYIRNKEMLIILDNCEHLIGSVAGITELIAGASDRIRILATSREILHLKGERILQTGPLSLFTREVEDDKHGGGKSESVRLFADRARMTDIRFRLDDSNVHDVKAICKQADGIPLAIELIACRVRYMDPSTILERLASDFSDLPSPHAAVSHRQKTMNDTIAWSYHLLTQKERILFRRVSVFSGGFDLEAAEQVCRDHSLPRKYILDLLSRLVDKSMIITIRHPGQPMRYNLLEPLRLYANGLIRRIEGKKLRSRHLDYYSSIAEDAYRERFIAQAHWTSILVSEYSNLMTALHRAEEHDPEAFSHLAGLLAWFWNRSNNYFLPVRIFSRVLAAKSAGEEDKARVLSGYGLMLGASPDKMNSAITMLEEARILWDKLNKKEEEAVVLADLALAAFTSGDDKKALGYARQAYHLSLSKGNPGTILYCLLPLSQGLVNRKELEEAKEISGRVLVEAKALGNYFALWAGHHHLGDIALMEGNFQRAEREYGKGIEIVSKYRDMAPAIVNLTGMAMAAAGQGRYAKALKLNSAAKAAAERMGTLVPEDLGHRFWQELIRKLLIGTRMKLGPGLTKKYESEGSAMKMVEAIAYALDFGKD